MIPTLIGSSRAAVPAAFSSDGLVNVGGAVVVAVALLGFTQFSIDPVAGSQDQGGQERGQHGTAQHTDLDSLIPAAVGAVGQITNQQRDGEANTGQRQMTGR